MSQQKQQPLSVQQILLFHETRLKQLDETLNKLTESETNATKEQTMKENNVLKTMAMNQRNFNGELEKFANRVTKVEQLLIDVSVELSKLKNLIVTTEQPADIEEVTLEVVEQAENVKDEVKVAVQEELREQAAEQVVATEETKTNNEENGVTFQEEQK